MLTQKKNLIEKGIFTAIIAVLIITTGVFIYLILNNRAANELGARMPTTTPIQSVEVNDYVTPTPMPFEEMTIPHLRERNYQSVLGAFNAAYERDDFTVYTTSYDSDGLRVNGLITRPKGDMPEGGWPAVVFVHGYIPPQQYRTLEKYEDYVNYLAGKGLVVFKIDLRGHGNSEGISHGAYYSSDYIIDTLNAHSALQNTDFVNPERIGLWGHSMAGNVVFRSFVASNINKVVIWAGAVYTYEDFQDFRIQDNSYQPPPQASERRRRREELFNIHGDFDSQHPFWKQIIPTNYLEGKTGAVQVHHAINDDVVDIRYSRNLMQILDGTEIENKLYEYMSGGHNLSGSSFSQAMQRTADFYIEE